MKKIFLLLLLAAPLNIFALDQDTAFRAMKNEMARNKTSLQMKNFPAPYFISYHLQDDVKTTVLASLGALIADASTAQKLVYVNMRAGGSKFDNTGFGNPRPAAWLAGDGYASIRSALWLASDDAYSNALEMLSRKAAYKQQRNITDAQPDFSKSPVVNLAEPRNEEVFDRAYFADAARQMSAAGKDFKELKKFVVTITFLNRQKYYVDSEGSSYYQNPVAVDVDIVASLQTKDGYDIDKETDTVYAAVKDVPPSDELIKKARDFAARTAAFYSAKKAESYIGPVLLEGVSAAAFFDDMFVDKIQNTKPYWKDNDGDDPAVGYLIKLFGLRVFSPNFNVYDDPGARDFKGKALSGFYRVDDEGVLAKFVNLVTLGKLTGLLTTRSLIKGQTSSSGHARGSFLNVPRETVSNLVFEPVKTTADMKKALMDECKKLGLEYCIKVNSYLGDESNGYKVYTKDGREEPVYGMKTDITTRSLRDIIYAGDDIKAYNVTPNFRPAYSVIAPSVIVTEVEIKPTDKKASKPPMVPKP